jgi:hypothetical protein
MVKYGMLGSEESCDRCKKLRADSRWREDTSTHCDSCWEKILAETPVAVKEQR